MPVTEITPEELAPRIGSVTLIDVRQPDEYTEGHVPTARLIPLQDVPERVAELAPPEGGEVFLICRTGARSLAAAEYLADNGVPAVNVAGGTLAWIRTGREVVTGDQPT